MAMQDKERILVIAHAHPDFSLGGGEIAAYNLFRAYSRHVGVVQAWFLGRADRGRGATGAIGMRRANEYIWEQGIGDWHLMKAAHRDSLLTWFADLIRALRPTVVHAHHYMHLGLEFLRVIKQVDPDIRIFMTLHEYMAICRNNGQMIKTSGRLCSRATPDECRQCFPQHSAEDFWLREHFFRRHFDLMEGFISPSEFLRDRYVAWGIPRDRVAVIENGQETAPQLPPRRIAADETRHAELARDIDAWARQRLPRASRARVIAARGVAVRSLERSLHRRRDPELYACAGMPTPATARRLLEGLRAELWAA